MNEPSLVGLKRLSRDINPLKNIVIYANCQAVALGSMFQLISGFKSEYAYARIRPVHRISAEEIDDLTRNTLPSVGAFIHQPVRDGFRNGPFSSNYVKSFVPEGVPVLSFPSLQFYGYQPSSFPLKGLTLEQRTSHTDIFQASAVDTFHFAQIIRSYLDGDTPHQALKRFHSGYSDDGDAAIDFARRSLGKILEAEKLHDIDITAGNFIKSNYRKTQLFNAPRHPTTRLLIHAVKQIMSELGVKITKTDMARLEGRNPLRYPAYPLQNYVREALKLTFPGEEKFSVLKGKLTLSQEDMVGAFYKFYDLVPKDQLDNNLKLAARTAASV